MSKWIPLMMVAALALFPGCKKSEPSKAEPAADTTAVLPEPPDLEPVDELFPDTTPEPEATTKPAKKAPTSDGLTPKGGYTLQVGIYNNERQATRLAEKLKGQGFPSYVARVEDPTPNLSGTYYRVRVGSFASSQAARAYGEANLAPAGIDFWADLKGRDSQPVKQVFKPKTLPTPAPTPAPKPVESAPAPTPTPEPTSPAPPAVQDTKPAGSLPDW